MRCRPIALLACALAFAFAAAAGPSPSESGSAPALRRQQAELADELANSPLGRPIHLVSSETAGGLQGDVYALVDYPIDEVRRAFSNSGQWCEMLLLHINNRRCRVRKRPDGDNTLVLSVVRRYDKPVEEAFELAFVHRTVNTTPDYLFVDLSAASGPLGTSHYRVVLEAVPQGERQTFVHFGYAYDHNLMARLATSAYLATFGSHKVGFTVTGKSASGQPAFIRGTRGLVERNSMRYFMTFDAYLDGAAAPPAEQNDRRLRRWFDGVERYPTQLHEIDLATYLAIKRVDRQRDATASTSSATR